MFTLTGGVDATRDFHGSRSIKTFPKKSFKSILTVLMLVVKGTEENKRFLLCLLPLSGGGVFLFKGCDFTWRVSSVLRDFSSLF